MLCYVQKLNGRSNLLVSSIRGSNRFASLGGPHVGVMNLVPVRGMFQAYVQASTRSNKAFSLYGFLFSLLCCCSDSPIKQASFFLLCFSSQLNSSGLLHQANSRLKKKKFLTNQRKKKSCCFFSSKTKPNATLPLTISFLVQNQEHKFCIPALFVVRMQYIQRKRMKMINPYGL